MAESQEILMETKEIEILDKEEKYCIKSDKDNDFNVKIKKYSSYIEIEALNQNYNTKKFIEKYTLQKLHENKFLLICESIDDIYDELIFLFSKNTAIIKEKENILNIIISIEHAKYKELNFKLKSKQKTNKELYEELYNIISNLQKENKIKDEKINKCNQEINNLKSEINNMKKQIDILNETIKNNNSFGNQMSIEEIDKLINKKIEVFGKNQSFEKRAKIEKKEKKEKEGNEKEENDQKIKEEIINEKMNIKEEINKEGRNSNKKDKQIEEKDKKYKKEIEEMKNSYNEQIEKLKKIIIEIKENGKEKNEILINNENDKINKLADKKEKDFEINIYQKIKLEDIIEKEDKNKKVKNLNKEEKDKKEEKNKKEGKVNKEEKIKKVGEILEFNGNNIFEKFESKLFKFFSEDNNWNINDINELKKIAATFLINGKSTYEVLEDFISTNINNHQAELEEKKKMDFAQKKKEIYDLLPDSLTDIVTKDTKTIIAEFRERYGISENDIKDREFKSIIVKYDYNAKKILTNILQKLKYLK